MEEELWKKIEGRFNYSVSNTGKIRNDRNGKILKPHVGYSGYPMVRFTHGASTVHLIVAKNWLSDGYFDGAQVDHLDMVKTNNHVSNLEWVTPKENSRRAREVYPVKGENNPQSVITDEIARYIKYETFGKTNNELADELCVRVDIVERVRRGERWCHVIDLDLDCKLASGEISYAKGKYANFDDGFRDDLVLFVKGGCNEKEFVSKFGVSRNTFYRIKKELRNTC